MSSVWDDPEIDQEEVTPLPDTGKAAEESINLSPEKLEELATQVIEKVVRETVPELAERLINEKLAELLKDA